MLLVIVRRWPIGAIPAEMPGVSALASTICHRSPLLSWHRHYENVSHDLRVRADRQPESVNSLQGDPVRHIREPAAAQDDPEGRFRSAAHPAPPADRRTSRSRARSSTRAALTRFSASAIVSRIAIDPPTPIRAPHASPRPRFLPDPLPSGAPRAPFKFQTPLH